MNSLVSKTSDCFPKHFSKKNELCTCSQKELCNWFINMSVLFQHSSKRKQEKYILSHTHYFLYRVSFNYVWYLVSNITYQEKKMSKYVDYATKRGMSKILWSLSSLISTCFEEKYKVGECLSKIGADCTITLWIVS